VNSRPGLERGLVVDFLFSEHEPSFRSELSTTFDGWDEVEEMVQKQRSGKGSGGEIDDMLVAIFM